MRRILAIILLFSTLNLFGDKTTPVPEPYQNDEFLPVLQDVRRATVVFAGALPLGYMYSSIAFDSFLADEDFYAELDREKGEDVEFKLMSSLIFAGVVTIIDMIIEKFFRRSNE